MLSRFSEYHSIAILKYIFLFYMIIVIQLHNNTQNNSIISTYSFTCTRYSSQLLQFQQTYQDDLGSADRAVDQAIERVEANIAWMVTSYSEVVTWLTQWDATSEPGADSINDQSFVYW